METLESKQVNALKDIALNTLINLDRSKFKSLIEIVPIRLIKGGRQDIMHVKKLNLLKSKIHELTHID